MTNALRAFDYRFTISGSEGGQLASLLEPLRMAADSGAPNSADAQLDGIVGVDRRDGRYAVTVDGRVVRWNSHLDRAIASAIWHITQAGINSRPGSLLLHAAAVVIDGTVVIISGRSGSGKSTLAAELVDIGGLYLTDEAVEIDQQGRVTDWLPRPIALTRSPAQAHHDTVVTASPGPIQHLPEPGSRLAPTERPPDETAIVLLGELGTQARQVHPRRSEVVARLIGESFPPASIRPGSLNRIERLTSSAPRLELLGGTPTQRAEAIGAMLAGGRRP